MRRVAMKWAAIILGILPVAFVAAVGVAAIVLPPRGPERSEWVRLVEMKDLPTDGTPEAVVVVMPQYDGWIRNEDQPVDRVFVRRTDDGVKVLRARHHLGAYAYYDSQSGCFRSPCWIVTFDLDGKVMSDELSKSFADLGEVTTQIRDGVVYVRRDDWGK